MKAFKLLLPLFCVIALCFTIAQNKRVKVYMIGDSTMANKSPNNYPETGWGMKFGEFFTKDVVIDNRAQNGRSTKSFINEKRWQAIADSLKPGDYVFIEFGHNDEKIDKPTVGTTLDEFKTNLLRFINETKQKGGIPVLMTPVVRRNFVNGVLTDTHGAYPDVVRAVAAETHVAFIDMQRKSEKLVIALGDVPSIKLWNWADSGVYKGFPKGVKDNTHFNPTGARAMAALAAEGVKESGLPLAGYLVH